MSHVIKSTPADRAVDFARAADNFKAAAEHLATALSLTEHHGAATSYGKAVRESIEMWAQTAADQAESSLKRARGEHAAVVGR